MAEGLTARPPLDRRIRAFIATALFLAMATAAALTWPAAPGTSVLEDGGTRVDLSNAAFGYISVRHAATGRNWKLRIARGGTSYTYDLADDGSYGVFPLQMGSGSYAVTVYRQVKGAKYAQDAAFGVDVLLSDENAAFLCPNQYVWYTLESPAVAKSGELCEGLSSDRARANAIYKYIVDHMVYNHMRALTVESGYLPDIDAVYADAMGICFDFSALMAGMLRAQEIPARMVIGYADENYHAWNEVLLGGEWVRYDPTAEITNTRVQAYTAERYY